ncbi:phosphoesterase RecJ domain-containing protein [Pelagirhabdus alkalitolerans]|uniref:Phosphoesterase RecJ domain-containing protein n=1 Tax=Pelagirhabdus alkalitolerans TaxID=1612202 RepID=A0A1G6HJD8_9BACI|nr:bifunctional oligoribonuclease/PAP phosphatase NrnA [Pelagirhabdus alkalitolerans]SDB94447.1 phosphoesterase RecJ domain-containing protein [Pelagirhabdus alkalitolerans]
MTIKQEILNKIKTYDTIIIHRHVRPDPDAIGSQVGLLKAIKATYPEKRVFSVGENDPSLTYLATMDQVQSDYYKSALVIVNDTANRPRVDDERFSEGEAIIKIDHHPEVDPYGDISWVDPTASSTSEMIYQLTDNTLKNRLEITDDVARLLYAGIVGDTGRFLFPSTSTQTFEVASNLVAYNFDRSTLYNKMYEVDQSLAKLKGYLLQQVDVESNVTSVKLTKEILNEYKVSPDDTSKLVGTYGDIKGVSAWAIFVEEEDIIRVRLRSKQNAINELAARFNGGGHALAAGATVYSWQEADQLITELQQLCR